MMKPLYKKTIGWVLLAIMALWLVSSTGNPVFIVAAGLVAGGLIGWHLYKKKSGGATTDLDESVRQSAEAYDQRFDKYEPEGQEKEVERDLGIWLDGDGDDWKRE